MVLLLLFVFLCLCKQQSNMRHGKKQTRLCHQNSKSTLCANARACANSITQKKKRETNLPCVCVCAFHGISFFSIRLTRFGTKHRASERASVSEGIRFFDGGREKQFCHRTERQTHGLLLSMSKRDAGVNEYLHARSSSSCHRNGVRTESSQPELRLHESKTDQVRSSCHDRT